MVELDFDGKESSVSDYRTVPAGTYVCVISELREGTTRNGDARWSLRLNVAEGEYTGRLAAWDSLVMTQRGLNRVRRVLAAFHLPHDGKVELEPGDLEGLKALVEVRPAEYVSPTGETIKRNEVPYDGYRPLARTDGSEPAGPSDAEGDPIPF